MPLSHALDGRTVWITTVGDVQFDDGIAALGRALDDARRSDPDAAWDIVFDVRRSSESRSSGELQGIAAFVAENAGVLSGRLAVVAGDDFHFGLSRMFQAYCEQRGLTPTVVRDPDAARDWLESQGASRA